MDSSMIGLAILMGWVLLIHGGLTYLVTKKKEFSLISGFGRRSEEEQEYLIENGYMDALGKVLWITFYILTASILLLFLPLPYGFEIGMGVFVLVLLGGMLWVQKYEVPHKRKRNMWIHGIVSVGTLVLIVGLSVLGLLENSVTIENDSVTISGVYGETIASEDIVSVELLNSLPDVKIKSNGFAMFGELKGRFRLEDPYDGALLFADTNETPVLYIKTKEDDVFLSRTNKERTKELYNDILELIR